MAVLSLDGPGQGEGGYTLPIRHDYEVAATAILDALDGPLRPGRRARASASAATTRPRAATFEKRIKAVAGISGAFNFGALWESLPELTRETFAHKSGATRRRGRARSGR